jgi:DNA modification methylase
MNYEKHEFNIFPEIKKDSQAYEQLKESIKSGYRKEEPLIIFEGKILDGWNRYLICKEIDETAPTRIVNFSRIEAIEYIKGSNARRDTTEEQRGAIYIRLHSFEMLEVAENEKRKKISQSMQGKQNAKKDKLDGAEFRHHLIKEKQNSVQDEQDVTSKKSNQKSEKTRDIIAKETGVSKDKIQFLLNKQKENPEILQKIIDGELDSKIIQKQEKQEKLEKKKQEIIKKESESVKDNKPIAYNKDAVSFLNTFHDNSIDILMTDPPYSTDIKDIKSFAFEWVTLALSKVKKEGRGYICIGAYPIELHSYLDVFLNQGKFILDNPLIWTYRNTLGVTPKDKYNLNYQVILHFYSKESKQLDTSITNEMFSVQDINAPDGRQGDRLHTWQKPIELANRLVRHSSKPNDLLVDPFCCTGTFLIAGSTYNCKSIGNDLSLENLKIAESRGIELAN